MSVNSGIFRLFKKEKSDNKVRGEADMILEEE